MSRRLHSVLLLIGVVPILSQWQGGQKGCGFKPAQSPSIEIVGGEEADDYEWPWQAGFYFNGRRRCGASVIDENWVITAAHCVPVVFEPELFSFRVGSNNLSETESAFLQWRTAIQVYVHPEYEGSTYDNDIALFQVDKIDLWANGWVNTVCLPTTDMADQFEVGDNATVTGWGNLEEGGSSPEMLHEVVVPIYDQDECNASYSGSITDNMICAGVPEGGVDSCQGDSGGPMVALSDKNEQQYFLIGVVSWGNGCARPDYPGVYTRVTQYEDWIKPIFEDGVEPTRKYGDCTDDEFLCRGGLCEPVRYRCDSRNDCYYGTDEEFCDGLLKMFDVYYYTKISTGDVIETSTVASKEDCADACLVSAKPCSAFDVTPMEDGNYTCELGRTNFTTDAIANDADRTFNHFEIKLKGPDSTFFQAAGVIASPSYNPEFITPAPGIETYKWTIMIDLSYKDSLRFTILSVTGDSTCETVDQGFALLSIDGKNSVDRTSFCLNAAAEGAEVSMPSTEATIEFMTSDASEFGFLLEYTSYYDCNKEYTIAPGAVMSPNYPSNYPNNVKCTTHIQAPEGQVVYFSINDMSIEPHRTCSYDSLRIYNGSTEDAALLGRGPYCGSSTPSTLFQSSDRDMLIVFQSDSSATDKGFSGSYYFGKATFGTTLDPKIAQIANLEDELSGYKFGIAAACIFAALLILTLSASLYTVNKRDAENFKRLHGDLSNIENGDECDGEKPRDRGYSRMEEEESDGPPSVKASGSVVESFTKREDGYEDMRVDVDNNNEQGKDNQAFQQEDRTDDDSEDDNLQDAAETVAKPTLQVVEAEVNEYRRREEDDDDDKEKEDVEVESL